MIRVLHWIGQLGYHVGLVVLVVMLMFTMSVSALRLAETPSPMERYNVQPAMWPSPPPQRRSKQVGFDAWFINRAPKADTPDVRSDRSLPLRL